MTRTTTTSRLPRFFRTDDGIDCVDASGATRYTKSRGLWTAANGQVFGRTSRTARDLNNALKVAKTYTSEGRFTDERADA